MNIKYLEEKGDIKKEAKYDNEILPLRYYSQINMILSHSQSLHPRRLILGPDHWVV